MSIVYCFCRRIWPLLIILSFSICNGKSLPVESSLKTRIKNLKKNGGMPTLDKSDSLKGPDSNNNGIRDDIEKYIAKTYIHPEKKAAVIQLARAYQNILSIEKNDKVSVKNVGIKMNKAFACIFVKFPFREGRSPSDISGMIKIFTFNTKKRVTKYIEVDKAMRGMVFQIPNRETSCE